MYQWLHRDLPLTAKREIPNDPRFWSSSNSSLSDDIINVYEEMCTKTYESKGKKDVKHNRFKVLLKRCG